MTIQLRPYQEKAVEWVLSRARIKPDVRLLIVLPAGGGKTAIAAALLRLLVFNQEDMRGLFVAHREELLVQARNATIAMGIAENCIGNVDSISKERRIVFGSVDAVKSRNDLPVTDLLITDEAHRDAAEFRRRLRKGYSDVLRVGFTATPERLDGKNLREDFDEMYVAAQPSELIAAGYLVAPKVFTVPKEKLPDLRGIRLADGEYDAKDIESRSNKPALLGNIVEHWKSRAEGRKTMAFACSREHSLAIVERFKKEGISAEHVDGKTSKGLRESALSDFKAGKISILSSCDLLSEGIDIPSVKCVIMARPTASLIIVNQQAGRCMRPSPADKRTALILDHAGNIARHGYPHADREWSLDSFRSREAKKPEIVVCPKCHAMNKKGLPCLECKGGKTNPFLFLQMGSLVELPGELVSLASALPVHERTREYNKLLAFAAQRGFDSDWANRVYTAKFGEKHRTNIESAS